ncbi:MAG: hypothetical protein GY799_01890, partial [Desulfobulbaceae bacterium]|nr:hypothetical protein [Desulfobulbaceae bacterium]
MTSKKLILVGFTLSFLLTVAAMAEITIDKIEPTPLFPKAKEGELLKQVARLSLGNDGEATSCQVRITVEGEKSYIEDIGIVVKGKSVHDIHVLDIAKPSKVTIDVLELDKKRSFTTKALDWQPQKKWRIHNVAFSHHDLGYADYFHLMRRDVREMGIDLALEYCTKTDDWDKDSQYRWTVETSEPLSRWIQNNSRDKVDELIRRINEGRIDLGAIHNSAGTEMLNYEQMARLFYTPNRYIVDMLGIEPRKTAILDDVVGLTRSVPLYTKEADVPYFYHGRNNLEHQMRPASLNPVYYWMAQDGDREHMPLFRTEHYHATPNKDGDMHGASVERIAGILKHYEQSNWPYYCVKLRECWDFSLPVFKNTALIRDWNETWSYPRFINSTMTMYFDDIASQLVPDDIYVFDKDAPNSWADQHSTDAKWTGQYRIVADAVPAIETF